MDGRVCQGFVDYQKAVAMGLNKGGAPKHSVNCLRRYLITLKKGQSRQNNQRQPQQQQH
jgi:hypothetical protein